MALHRTLEEHDANPPESWEVVKVTDRIWHLRQRGCDYALDTFTTRKAAEQAKVSGWLVTLYRDEGRWFAGLPVAGWRPYEEVRAERERVAAKWSVSA